MRTLFLILTFFFISFSANALASTSNDCYEKGTLSTQEVLEILNLDDESIATNVCNHEVDCIQQEKENKDLKELKEVIKSITAVKDDIKKLCGAHR